MVAKKTQRKRKTYKFCGLPRVDAKERIVLRILPKDKKNAVRNDPWKCIIAQSCKRQFATTSVAVGKSAIHVLSPNKKFYIRYNMPPSLKKEQHGFDRGGQFDGGEYQLSPFPKSKKLGKYQGSRTRPKKPTGNKRPSVRHVTGNVRGRPEEYAAA